MTTLPSATYLKSKGGWRGARVRLGKGRWRRMRKGWRRGCKKGIGGGGGVVEVKETVFPPPHLLVNDHCALYHLAGNLRGRCRCTKVDDRKWDADEVVGGKGVRKGDEMVRGRGRGLVRDEVEGTLEEVDKRGGRVRLGRAGWGRGCEWGARGGAKRVLEEAGGEGRWRCKRPLTLPPIPCHHLLCLQRPLHLPLNPVRLTTPPQTTPSSSALFPNLLHRLPPPSPSLTPPLLTPPPLFPQLHLHQLPLPVPVGHLLLPHPLIYQIPLMLPISHNVTPRDPMYGSREIRNKHAPTLSTKEIH